MMSEATPAPSLVTPASRTVGGRRAVATQRAPPARQVVVVPQPGDEVYVLLGIRDGLEQQSGGEESDQAFTHTIEAKGTVIAGLDNDEAPLMKVRIQRREDSQGKPPVEVHLPSSVVHVRTPTFVGWLEWQTAQPAISTPMRTLRGLVAGARSLYPAADIIHLETDLWDSGAAYLVHEYAITQPQVGGHNNGSPQGNPGKRPRSGDRGGDGGFTKTKEQFAAEIVAAREEGRKAAIAEARSQGTAAAVEPEDGVTTFKLDKEHTVKAVPPEGYLAGWTANAARLKAVADNSRAQADNKSYLKINKDEAQRIGETVALGALMPLAVACRAGANAAHVDKLFHDNMTDDVHQLVATQERKMANAFARIARVAATTGNYPDPEGVLDWIDDEWAAWQTTAGATLSKRRKTPGHGNPHPPGPHEGGGGGRGGGRGHDRRR